MYGSKMCLESYLISVCLKIMWKQQSATWEQKSDKMASSLMIIFPNYKCLNDFSL